MSKRRVVITGVGIVAPNGIGKDAFWNSLINGKSGIKRITLFDASSFPTQIAGEVNDFIPSDFMDKQLVERTGRSTQFAMAAVKMCLEDSYFSINTINPQRIGLILGTSSNAMDITEHQIKVLQEKGVSRIRPSTISSISPHAATGLITSELGITGTAITVSTTCNAGADAIGMGFEDIKNNNVDIAICGAAEAPLTYTTFSGFCASRMMSTKNGVPNKASRPFDIKRDGGVLSEGAAVVMIEELEHAINRNSPIYAELLSYARGTGRNHLDNSSSDYNGIGMDIVMEKAIKQANLHPSNIDYVCAHAPSDPLLDRIETNAIKKILNEHAYHIPVSSIKSMTGNLLSAAGPMQVIASLMAMKDGVIPPTINYEFPDPECDLDYVPNVARRNKVDTVLINSHGLGGSNASLIVSKFDEA